MRLTLRLPGMMRRCGVWILALTAVSIGYAGTIVNGDFETGTIAPWIFNNGSAGFYTGAAWSIESAAAHSGVYGARADGNWGIKQIFAGVPGDDIDSLTFWLRRPTANLADNGQIQVLMTLYYSDNTSGWYVNKISSNDWIQFDATGKLNPAKTLIGVDTYGYLSCAGKTPAQCAALGPFTTYVDDIRLTRKSELSSVPEPRAFWLVGVAGIGLLARRRRR